MTTNHYSVWKGTNHRIFCSLSWLYIHKLTRAARWHNWDSCHVISMSGLHSMMTDELHYSFSERTVIWKTKIDGLPHYNTVWWMCMSEIVLGTECIFIMYLENAFFVKRTKNAFYFLKFWWNLTMFLKFFSFL